MKLFFDCKCAVQSIPHSKMFWVFWILFPFVSSCTSLNDQFDDTASLAQTQSAEAMDEKSSKKNKLYSSNNPIPVPDDDGVQSIIGNKERSSTKNVNSQQEQMSKSTNAGEGGNDDSQPKTLLSMFSSKNNETEENIAPLSSSNVDGSKKNKVKQKPDVTDLVNAEPLNDQSKSEQSKSLFSMFSNKQKNDQKTDDTSNLDSTSTNEAINLSASNKILAGRAGSQDKGARLRLFSGNSDSSGNDSDIGATNKLASIKPDKVDRSQYSGELPGVRPNGGIEIKHRSSLYDDTDIDANEVEAFPSIQLASVGGLGRSLPNGLRLAHKAVDARCLKPQLINLLKTIERNYNRPVYITSGYRNPIYNRKVNGANRSLHMSCAAADIIVPGVHKYEVAKFVRSLPGRGGVGTYCHQAIHVDIGPRRDWNWSCSGKK